MGPPIADTGEVRSGPEGVGTIIRCGCANKTDLWAGGLGGDPPHGADPGWLHLWVVRKITGKLPK